LRICFATLGYPRSQVPIAKTEIGVEVLLKIANSF